MRQAFGIIAVFIHCHKENAVGNTTDPGFKAHIVGVVYPLPCSLPTLGAASSHRATESKAPPAPQRREGAPVLLHCPLPFGPGVSTRCGKEQRGPSPSSSPIPVCRTLVPLPLRAGGSRTRAWVPAQGCPSFGKFPAGVTGHARGNTGLQHRAPPAKARGACGRLELVLASPPPAGGGGRTASRKDRRGPETRGRRIAELRPL